MRIADSHNIAQSREILIRNVGTAKEGSGPNQIRLTGIRATGKHGVLDFEHERAQTFVVDATLFLDLAAAGRSDQLNDTVDYGAVAKGIVAIIEGEHVDLIEKLANRIVGMILGFPAVCRTQVTVHKPNAPITVPFDDVSVTGERSRETVDSPSRERSSEHGQVHHAIIAMGGNQGDVTATLRDAVRCIDGLPSTQVTGVSPLYRTDAWGMPEGTAEFRNAVVSVDHQAFGRRTAGRFAAHRSLARSRAHRPLDVAHARFGHHRL